MKLLLTGATGFLGSHVLRALIDAGHTVTITLRKSSALSRISDLEGSFEMVDSEDMAGAFSRPQDAVIHCATSYGRGKTSVEEVIQSNLLFPSRVLNAAAEGHCPCFINTDSFFCKQLPARLLENRGLYSPYYTVSKDQFRQWGQLYAQQGKINFINLRLEHVYGENDRLDKFIPWVESKLKENAPYLDLTAGEQIRDFVNVKDVAQVYAKVIKELDRYSGYHSFDVGTGKGTTVKQFVTKLKDEMGSQTELRFGVIPTSAEEIMYSVADSTSPYLTVM